MNILHKLIRWAILSFILMLAIVVLGISAHLIAIRPSDYWRFAALAVAVSSLTILTLPIFILVGTLARHESVQAVVGAEAVWLTIMWILWLSTAANSTRAARNNFFRGACGAFSIYGSKTCNEFKVVEAFSYIIFIILLCYSIGLLVYACSYEDGGVGRTQRGGVETGQKQPQTQQRQQHLAAPGQSTDATQKPQGQPAGLQFPEPNK